METNKTDPSMSASRLDYAGCSTTAVTPGTPGLHHKQCGHSSHRGGIPRATISVTDNLLSHRRCVPHSCHMALSCTVCTQHRAITPKRSTHRYLGAVAAAGVAAGRLVGPPPSSSSSPSDT